MEVKELSFKYGEKAIFENVSFSFEKGEFISIVGTSGCGKSTLLKVLNETYLTKSNESLFAYMPQDDLLMPWKTVLENACLYGEIHKKDMKEKAKSLLHDFGLLGVENSYPKELSGGMKKRVAFLRTVLCEKDFILLDEPFGALDAITKNKMQDWLMKLCQSLDIGVLMVTHDIEEAMYLSDKIYVLKDTLCEIPFEKSKKTREWVYENMSLRERIQSEL